MLLGDRLARYTTPCFIAFQFLLVVYLMVIGFFTPVMLIVFLSLPMFFRMVLPMYRHPRPAERPEDYPAEIWPLGFVASAFAFEISHYLMSKLNRGRRGMKTLGLMAGFASASKAPDRPRLLAPQICGTIRFAAHYRADPCRTTPYHHWVESS